MEEKKVLKKIKYKFEHNKLIFYVYSNSFYLFLFIIYIKTKKLKIYKILRNFDYV